MRAALANGVPREAWEAMEYIRQWGKAPPGYVGGRTFANDGRNGGQALPRTDAYGREITYREYDIAPHTPGMNRGQQRIVLGRDGSANYTRNHYVSFAPFGS